MNKTFNTRLRLLAAAGFALGLAACNKPPSEPAMPNTASEPSGVPAAGLPAPSTPAMGTNPPMEAPAQEQSPSSTMPPPPAPEQKAPSEG